MKKLFTFAVAAAMLGALSVACKKDPNKPPVIPEGHAAFTSFGFYAEDNEGVLEEDYVVEAIADRMVLRLPKTVDKSALVARFETLDNNKVYVGDVLQESGVTVNNFTSIVDYEIVEPETTGFKEYEVQLRNILEMKLTKLGTYTTPDHLIGTEISAAYSAADDSYYIFYNSQEETNRWASPNRDMDKGYIIKWDGTAFTKVGTGSATEAGASSFDIKVDADGTPYVLYTNDLRTQADGTTQDATTNGYVSLRKFSGEAWTAVGSDLVNSASKPSVGLNNGVNLVINPATKNPITAWFNNTNNITVARRSSLVSFYNGTSWDTDITPADVAGNYGYGNIFATHNNDIYYEVYQQNIKKYVVMKYASGTTFAKLFDIDCSVAESEFYQSGGTVIPQTLAVSPNGNLYMTISANPETTWIHNIYRYNNETKVLTMFGGSLGVTPTQRTMTAISFDNKNSPVVVMKVSNELSGGPVELKVIDPDTNQWSNPVQLCEKSPKIAVVSDGKGGTFIAFPTALPDVVIGQNSSGSDVIVTPYEINIWSFALEEDAE